MLRVPFMIKGLAAALLAGTYVLSTSPDLLETDSQAPGGSQRWRALLEPTGGGTVRGGAMVEVKGEEGLRFTVTVRNAPANTTLPWHMHAGTCAAPGDVVGSGYPELNVGPGGTAEAAVTLKVAAPTTGAFVIQVHSPTGAAISCGDLKLIGER